MEAAHAAGLVGRRRVLDSTPLYDAVATMDTVTLIRSALRGLLKVADAGLEAELRAALAGWDNYVAVGKPQIDWDDPDARAVLIASRARDGYAVLAVLHGRELTEAVEQASALLATVLGQDLDPGEDGVFRTARRVAKDRVISTVDPDARHGHKTASRGFDGYKGHAAVDPDSEIVAATTVTPGNTGDTAAAEDLITDLLDNTDGPGTGAGHRRAGHRRAGHRRAGHRRAGHAWWAGAHRLRGCRLWHGRVPRAARRGRELVPVQDPGADRGGRVVQQGPLRDRRGCDDRDLPGRGQRPDPGAPQR